MRTGKHCCLFLFLTFFFACRLAAQPPVWDSVKTLGNNRYVGFRHAVAYLLNASQQPLSSGSYSDIRPFCGTLAAVKRGDLWGFVNAAGVEVVQPQFDVANDFAAGRAIVCQGDACSYIDASGRPVVQQTSRSSAYENRLAKQARSYAEELSVFGNQRSASTMPCPPNIDFESGTLANWQTNIGTVTVSGLANLINLPQSGWQSGAGQPLRHVLQDRTATSPSSDYYGHFPVNPSNGGRYSVKLGGDDNLGTCGTNPCPNARAEAVRYVVNVPANATNYSITFSYAVVLENPLAGVNLHKDYEQPRFTVKMYDPVTAEVIPCANFTFVASGPLPGFDTSNVRKSADAVVRTKNWSSVYVNMSKFAGRTFYLEFTTADCTKGGHFGYAYVDVIECGIAARSQTRCAPANVTTLYGPPGFENYQWFDAGFSTQVGNTQNVVLDPAPAIGTQYWVVATPYANTGCPTCDCRDTVKVEVRPNFPDANAGPDRSLCDGGTTTIGTPAVAGLTYVWTPTTGLADAAAATTLSTGVVPMYVLRVTDTFGCSITDTVNVRQWPKPLVAFSANNQAQCLAGNRFVFTNTSSISSGTITYAWDFGDGTFSTLKEATHSYTAAGNYTVELKVTSDSGCVASLQQQVQVHAAPLLTLGGGSNLTLCRGSSVQLRVAGADNYLWSPATGLSCTDCATPLASPVSPTTYFAQGTSALGCRSVDSVHLDVIQPLKVAAQSDTLCLGETITLQARGADRYTWTPATGLSSTTVASPVANPANTTVYRVVGYDNQNCFTDTALVTVLVAPVPTVNLGADLTLATGTTLQLQATTTGAITSWLWWPRSLVSCYNCPSPSVEVRGDAVYKVVVANAFGCTATDSLAVKAFCAEGQVYIPNAFTPDGDGVNDVFFVQGRGISLVKTLRIFNRWGELLMEKQNMAPNDARNGWDGRVRGVVGTPDVFVYTAEVVCSNGSVFFFKGNVSLLK